jgi:hypothetical protein
MRAEIVQSFGAGVDRREERALARSLGRLECQKVASLARLEATAQVEAARVEAVGYVGRRALETVALVSQWEVQLGQLCPAAVTRLQGIADITALATAEVVADAARKLS